MANKHLIGKQVLQMEIGPSENAYALQQRFSEMIWKELSPRLSDLFDRFAGEDEVLRLDKIELDLKEINFETSNNDAIIKKIIALLEVKLSHHKTLIASKASPDFKPEFENIAYSRRDYVFQLWLYWLEKGVLPPYALELQRDWMPMVLETLAMEHRAISALTETLRNDSNALQRLILQHKKKDLRSITELYTGLPQLRLLDFLAEFQVYFQREEKTARLLKTNYRELEIQFWKLIFGEVILKSKKLDSKQLIEKSLITHPEEFLRIMAESLENKKRDSSSVLSFHLRAIKSELNKTQEVRESQSREIVDKERGVETQKKLENKGEIETPQFLKNAGLVLLHPFLSRLFEKLKLLDKMRFKDFNSQNKAVLLLQFMASGESPVSEYELLLPKFLCGMPANLPLDYTIQLTKRDKKEANVLLEAVIENWGALGGTTPDGLREGFLIRDGKLYNKDSGWKLIVEPKTIDILLDRVPWNLSHIKLPWMEELLKVEWR